MTTHGPAAAAAAEAPVTVTAEAAKHGRVGEKAKAAPPFFGLEALRQGCQLVFLGDAGERPWFNVFLVFVPLAIVSENVRWPAGATFVLSLLAMLPLAERLGFATEELAEHVNETLAGLMNASMGNAPELIIAIFALKNGLLRVVQVSLLGSILSNLLLVLGTGLMVGGIYFKTQRFKNVTSTTSAGMLLTACMGLLLPTMLSSTQTAVDSSTSVLLASRISSLFMLGLYIVFLVFQLSTHQELYDDDEKEEAPAAAAAATPAASALAAGAENSQEGDALKGAPAADGGAPPKAEEEAAKEEKEEEIHLSLWGSIAWLAGITALVAYISELLVASIEGAAATWGLPEAFISCILLPVAGNAAEHASAIIFAAKNRLDVTFGIAIGSAMQISMFGIPLLVIIGWCINMPLSLDYQVFEVGSVLLATIMASFVMLDGNSHWMQGGELELERGRGTDFTAASSQPLHSALPEFSFSPHNSRLFPPRSDPADHVRHHRHGLWTAQGPRRWRCYLIR